jgi:hypothetical protein
VYNNKGIPSIIPNRDNVSTALFYQRLHVETEFIVSPGLKLVTRFDALERIWGGARSDVDVADLRTMSTRAESENIGLNLGYISYASPIGIFDVGYIHDNAWGTVFGNSDINGHATGGIEYILPIGNAVIGGEIYKEGEASKSYAHPSTYTDNDADEYCLWGMYNFTKDINAGLLYFYLRSAASKPVGDPLANMFYLNGLLPYFKAKIGPVYVEGEVIYGWGQIKMENGVPGYDIKIENILAYLNAKVDIGPVYIDGTFAYVSGDDPGTHDKMEGGILGGGADFNPCLIMFNNDLTYWVGPIGGYTPTANESAMTNAWFGQGKVGVRPIPALDINGSVSYAKADKKPASVSNDSYGWEFDVTGTYKITNNLSYMLGVGYWFVGDYYKGGDNGNALRDDYLVINKLTLTF